MTILLMIVLNNQAGASIFAPLVHSSWDGATLADMAFPFFLFIMGAAMWFSTKKHLENSGNRKKSAKAKQLGRIFKRTVILFGVGVLLNWLPFQESLSSVRIPGVLQRIALAYFFAAMLTLYVPRIKAILPIIVVLLGGYWLLLNSCGTDIVGKVDVWFFGANHLYTPTFDPEGLLHTIPAIASVLFGYVAGKLMDQPNNVSGGISSLLVIGVLIGVGGYLLSWVWPMNKQLWTGSYVLFTTGLAMLIWAVLSFIIEYMQHKKWGDFFVIAGTNSLYIYSLSIVLSKLFNQWGVSQAVYGFYQSYHVPDDVASLMWSLTMVLICWLLTWPLYRMKIFISA